MFDTALCYKKKRLKCEDAKTDKNKACSELITVFIGFNNSNITFYLVNQTFFLKLPNPVLLQCNFLYVVYRIFNLSLLRVHNAATIFISPLPLPTPLLLPSQLFPLLFSRLHPAFLSFTPLIGKKKIDNEIHLHEPLKKTGNY